MIGLISRGLTGTVLKHSEKMPVCMCRKWSKPDVKKVFYGINT